MDSVENIDSHLPLPRDWHQNFSADIVYTCGTTKLAMSLAQGKIDYRWEGRGGGLLVFSPSGANYYYPHGREIC